MPRPAIKKTFKLAKAAELGRLAAQIEHEYKSIKWLADILPISGKYKKNALIGIQHFISEHGEKVPKLVAILGLTYIIKITIDWTQGVFKTALERAVKMPFPFGMGRVEKGEVFVPAIKVGDETEMLEWLLSFTLAYIIIEHGGQIALGLGESFSSLTKIAAFFFA